MKKILLVVSLGLALSACANKGTIDKDAQITQDWSVEKLYAEAQDELNSNNYTRAVKLLRNFRIPFSKRPLCPAVSTGYGVCLL